MVKKRVLIPLILPLVVVTLSAFLVIVQLTSVQRSRPAQKFQFKCPQSEWVDCMPSPGQQKQNCSLDYLDWAKSNCPNFKGAAL